VSFSIILFVCCCAGAEQVLFSTIEWNSCIGPCPSAKLTDLWKRYRLRPHQILSISRRDIGAFVEYIIIITIIIGWGQQKSWSRRCRYKWNDKCKECT
jgi:hypothetical protein